MDEKKKMMVLAVLGVFFVGIGAFTFMPKSEEPPSTEKKEIPQFLKDNEQAKAAEPAPNPAVVAALSVRDPFKAPDSMLLPRNLGATTPPPATQPKAFVPKMTGKIRPFDFGQMPGASADNGTTVQPAGDPEKKVEEPVFGYTVGGVAIGSHPAVVFKDAQGNQRLVMLGGALDGDSKVIAVRMDSVDVSFHGKTLHLRVGGDSLAKQ